MNAQTQCIHNSGITDECTNKCGLSITVEYYLAFKRKEIPTHTTTRKNFKDIRLGEMSQLQRNKCCMIPLIQVPRVVGFTESRIVGPGAGGGGKSAGG